MANMNMQVSKSSEVKFKVKRQGHYGLLNNPYFKVLKYAKSWNNRYKHLYILKDGILNFKKKLTDNPSGVLNFDPKFIKLVLPE